MLEAYSKDRTKLQALLDMFKAKYPEAAGFIQEQQEERLNQDQEIASLTKQISIIKEKYLSSQKTIEQMKSQLSRFQDPDEQIKQFQVKEHASRLEIDRLSSELITVRSQFVAKDKLQELLGEIEDYKKQAAAARVEMEAQASEIAELKKGLHEAEKLEHHFEHQNYQLRQQIAQLESCKEAAVAAQERYLQYENLLANNAKESQSLRDLIQHLQSKLKEAEQQVSTWELKNFENRHQSEILESYKKAAEAAEARCQQYQSQLSELEHQRTDSQKKYEQALLISQNLEVRLRDSEFQLASLGEKADKNALMHAQAAAALEAFKSQQLERMKEFEALSLQLQSTQEKNALLNRYLDEAKAQISRDKSKVEKLSNLLFDKERTIQELQQVEVSLKRCVEIKQDLEKALEMKTQECQHRQAENEQLEADAKDRSLHIEQLERVIQFLRERSQEAQLELNQLRGEYQSAQDVMAAMRQDLDLRQAELAQADTVCKQSEELKHEALVEVASLQAQQEKLKGEIEKLQRDISHDKAQFEALQCDFARQVQANAELELTLGKKNEALESFDKEIGLIKQTLLRAVREAKELEALYLETVQEKINAVTKIHQYHQQLEKYRENQSIYKNELAKTKEQLQSHQVVVGQMESSQRELALKLQQQAAEHASEIESCQALIRNKEREIQTLSENHKKTEEEVAALKGSLLQLQQAQQESHEEVRTAQQHLAKKLKEMAILEDQRQKWQGRCEEMEKTRAQDQMKIVELQTALDVQKEHQLRQEQHLQDRLQAAERQQSKWEEKCQRLQTKLADLEKIEERYQQLHSLVSNFGAIMGGGGTAHHAKEADVPQHIPEPVEMEKENPAPVVKAQREENQIIAKPYQNLFDLPKSHGKYKQNLLD